MNDKKDRNGYNGLDWPIEDMLPWIVEEFEEKISTALGTDQLTSIYIDILDCKAVVANEFFDLLTFFVTEHGLDKLDLQRFKIRDSVDIETIDK